MLHGVHHAPGLTYLDDAGIMAAVDALACAVPRFLEVFFASSSAFTLH
jgi:hypothetical protein